MLVGGAYRHVMDWLNSNDINPASTGALALIGGSSETINMGSYASLSLGASGAATYNGTLTPAGAVYRLGGGGGTLTFASALTGSNSLAVTGPGTVVLTSTNNTYSGGTTLSCGQLNINATAALGSGALTISGGTIGNTRGTIVLSTNNTQNWNGDFTFAGPAALNLGTGTVTMGISPTVTITSNNLTVGGAISDSGGGYSLTKAGTGTLTLTGSDTYTGGTTISSGTLQLGNGTSNNGSVAGNITNNAWMTFANPNAQTFAGTISGSGSLTKTAAGSLILAGFNFYTGGTRVNGGVLQFNGNRAVPGSGTVTIKSGAAVALAPTGTYNTVTGWLTSGKIATASAGAWP